MKVVIEINGKPNGNRCPMECTAKIFGDLNALCTLFSSEIDVIPTKLGLVRFRCKECIAAELEYLEMLEKGQK